MSLVEAFRRRLRLTFPRPETSARPIPPGRASTDVESLGRELLRLDSGIGLFRWVNLVDALDRSPAAERAISFGSGSGLHEAGLARTRPTLDVIGVDLLEPLVARDLPNLRFLTGDLLDPAFRATLPRADFVYSIECLEHIEDDTTVAKAMAECLLPGGHFYVQVPFANRSEQANPVLCENELRSFGHVRPGYDEAGLRELARKLGLEVVFVAGAFWAPLQPIIGAAAEKLVLEPNPRWRDVLELASQDLRPRLPKDRNEAIAIKMLARKRG
jgi:SAM-dependent methyltransferase